MSGASSTSDMTIRWNENSLTGVSYAMFSTNTCELVARLISAPRTVSPGMNRRIAADSSTTPVNI